MRPSGSVQLTETMRFRRAAETRLPAASRDCRLGLVTVPFPEPTTPAPSRAEVFLRYLEFFRSRLVDKLEGLPPGELRKSQVPSGWTPIELIKHLTCTERRWLEWRFAGRDVGGLLFVGSVRECRIDAHR